MDRESEAMKMRKPRLKFARCRQPLTRLTAVFIVLISFGSSDARTPRYPELSVVRGTTPGGYPYMNGGVSLRRATGDGAGRQNLQSQTRFYPTCRHAGGAGSCHDRRQQRSAGSTKSSRAVPWFYIQLPPGGYTILARFGRQVVLVRNVKLSEGGRATFRLRGD